MRMHCLGLAPESFCELAAIGPEGSTACLVLPDLGASAWAKGWTKPVAGDVVWFEVVEGLMPGRLALMARVLTIKQGVTLVDRDTGVFRPQHVWDVMIGQAAGQAADPDRDPSSEAWQTPEGRRVILANFNAMADWQQSELVAGWFPGLDDDDDDDEDSAEIAGV